MLLTDAGIPQAPSEIVRRLKQINPSLDLIYLNGPGGTCWALAYRWNDTDPRQARIQSGEIPPDRNFDIAGFLPIECSPHEAYGYTVNHLRDTPVADIHKLLDGVERYNAEAQTTDVENLAVQAADEVGATVGAIAAPGSRNYSYGGIAKKKRK